MAHFWLCHRARIVHTAGNCIAEHHTPFSRALNCLSPSMGGPGALDQLEMGDPEEGG